MTYGFECRDLNGNIAISTNGRYSRLIYSGWHSDTGTITLPELDGKESIQWGESMSPRDGTALVDDVPVVSRNGTQIAWNNFGSMETFWLLVFIYT
jgi:hypothetical protein